MAEFTGMCYRHRLRFVPSEQFGMNCPACYWELEDGKKRVQVEQEKKKLNDTQQAQEGEGQG
jgi:hypothetical protein